MSAKASKNYHTMNEKDAMTSDTASVRSNSTMSSLKSLLPKKKAASGFDKVQNDRSAEATKHEARATYFAVR